MPTMVLRNPDHVTALSARLSARKLPMTVTWVAGASRTGMQNRLIHRWFQDVANQTGDHSSVEVKRYCKLHFGVPILRIEDDAFRAFYDARIIAATYEEKLDAMDFLPVTSRMTIKQLTSLMDAMQRHYLPQGIRLTDPEALKYEEEFQ